METASPKKTKTVVRKVLVKRPVKKVAPKPETKASTPLLSDLLEKDKVVAEPKLVAESKPATEEKPAPKKVLKKVVRKVIKKVPKKPVVEEPVVEEPVAEEPVVEESVAEEPVAEEPVAEEPVAEEPVAEEPVAEEPVAEEPVAEEPVAEEPVAEEEVVEEEVEEVEVAEEEVAEEEVVEEKEVVEEEVAEEEVAEEKEVEEKEVEEKEVIEEEPTIEEKNDDAKEEITEVVTEIVKENINEALDNIEMVEGINKDLMSALATKTNVSNLVKPALNMVISNIPQKKDGKPVIQISTLWHILEVTMEIVEDIKNIKKLSGSQAKQMVITILKELIDQFAAEDVKDNCSDLLVNSIPAAIDMVINAANGKLKVNASVLDLNGDGKLNKEDINRCLSICKLLSCCGSRETAAVN